MKLNVSISSDSLSQSAQIRFDCTDENCYMLSRLDEAIEFIMFASIDKKVQVIIYELNNFKTAGSSVMFDLKLNNPYENVSFYTIEKGYGNVIFAHTMVYECISKLTNLIRSEITERLKAGAIHEVA